MAVYRLDSFQPTGQAAIPLPQAFAASTMGVGRTNSPSVLTISGTSFDPTRGARILPSGTAIGHTGQYYDDTLAGLEEQYTLLRSAAGTRGQLWRTRLSDSAEQWCLARFVSEDSTMTWQEVLELTARLQFIKESPIWYAETITTTTETLTGSPQTVEVNNTLAADGGAPVSNVRVLVTAGNAPITALSVAGYEMPANTLKTHWSFNGTIAATETLTVDNGARSVTNDGTAAYDDFEIETGHALKDWLYLEPGLTELRVTYTGGGTGSEVEVQFYAGYS